MPYIQPNIIEMLIYGTSLITKVEIHYRDSFQVFVYFIFFYMGWIIRKSCTAFASLLKGSIVTFFFLNLNMFSTYLGVRSLWQNKTSHGQA